MPPLRVPQRRCCSPSPGAWQALLSRLGEGAESAGAEYEQLRCRIVRFFEWNRCSTAEDLADIVFNRVAGKLEAGEHTLLLDDLTGET